MLPLEEKANTENLGLENTSVELGKFGEVMVDDYLKQMLQIFGQQEMLKGEHNLLMFHWMISV